LTGGVVAVVVNWNGWRHTLECLRSLLREGHPGLGVVVVDNGSDDGSVEEIRRFCREGADTRAPYAEVPPGGNAPDVAEGAIVLLRSAANLGYTGGNNLGIRFAMGSMRPRHVLLLNNDVVVCKGLLRELLGAARASHGIGMWQPKVLMMRAPHTVSGVGIGIHPNGQTFMIGYGEPDDGRHDAPREVFAVYGCAVLCDTRMFEEVGLFEEGFFAYYEDIELSWRARLHGWGCMYVPSATVLHWEGASGAPVKGVLNLRNGVLCNLKNAPADLLVRMCLRAAYDLARFAATSTCEERRRCLRVARRFGLLGHVPGMLRSRRALKPRRLGSMAGVRRAMEPAHGARAGLATALLRRIPAAGGAAVQGVDRVREEA
jgi:GT2 family glycosyltransferase